MSVGDDEREESALGGAGFGGLALSGLDDVGRGVGASWWG